MYTNSCDANPGSILRSTDRGNTWSETKLPFKLPGNQPGRGVGERLVVDPANSNIIYFAAPSGHGLWKSTDQGVTFSQVASFTAVGNYAEDPSDTSGYNSDLTGLTSLVFDTTSGTTNGATSRIFVGTAYLMHPRFMFLMMLAPHGLP
jgi:xyloglucan-specific exo-beta-1,4-glucanase